MFTNKQFALQTIKEHLEYLLKTLVKKDVYR